MCWERVNVFTNSGTVTDHFKRWDMTIPQVTREIVRIVVIFRAQQRVRLTVQWMIGAEHVADMVRATRAQDISVNVRTDTRVDFVEVCNVDWVTRGPQNLGIKVMCLEMEVHIHGAGSAQIEVHAIVLMEHVHVTS